MNIPPLPMALLCAAGMGLIATADLPGAMALAPEVTPRLPAVAVLTLAGIGFIVAPAFAFRHAGTTLDPRDPARTSALVSSGIFRYSRNPIYVGFVALLAAWALYLGQLHATVVVPLFVFWLRRGQIAREETHLQALFGDQYRAYCQRVRRWL